MRHRYDKSSIFQYRLAQEAINLRRQARGMPEGIFRDDLRRKADQMDMHANERIHTSNMPASTSSVA